ncbi:hypothetical protein [Mycobacterium ulcerans]|nr:hypothetical protein [Mycobacterium ulcerans]
MRFPAAVLAIPTALLTACAISALPAVFPPATHAGGASMAPAAAGLRRC